MAPGAPQRVCHALLLGLIGWLLPMQSQSRLELSTELWRKLPKAHGGAATLLSVSYNSWSHCWNIWLEPKWLQKTCCPLICKSICVHSWVNAQSCIHCTQQTWVCINMQLAYQHSKHAPIQLAIVGACYMDLAIQHIMNFNIGLCG